MRILPLLAVVAASISLVACTLNTAPTAPPPATIVTPAPAPMMMTPAPSSPAVIVR